MGRVTAQLSAMANLSNHNSEQDVIDRAMWQDFVGQIRRIAEDPKYDIICIDVDASDIDQ